MNKKDSKSIRFDLRDENQKYYNYVSKERNLTVGTQLFLALLKEEYDRLKAKNLNIDGCKQGVVA